jgi:YhgE/Pip-like protein
VKALLRHPLAWGFVAAAVAMAIVMSLSYLGAFLDPIGNARDLPIAVVNEDSGAVVAGNRLDLGRNVVAALTSPRSPLGDAVEWSVLSSRREALARMSNDAAFAAVVIPRDYSERLSALAFPLRGLPIATTVDVLSNPAAGSLARSATEQLATSAVMDVSMRLAQQLAAKGSGGDAPAVLAHRVNDAVEVQTREATAIGAKSARGLAPFYFALMLGLAGFIGTVMISVGVEFLNGHLALDLFALRLHRPQSQLSRTGLWGAKLILVLALAALVGVLQTVFAVNVLGMTATNPVELGLFAVLGVAAAGMVTLTFLTAFGLAGSLLGVLFITILGVPASGGPYPIEMLPGFFRFLASWLPLRYLTDGARSLVFFDGNLDVGLGTAIWVLLVYVVGAAALGGTTALLIDRRLRRQAEPPSATPAAATSI